MTNFKPATQKDASGRITVRWDAPTVFTINSTHPEVPSGLLNFTTEAQASAFWLAFCLK